MTGVISLHRVRREFENVGLHCTESAFVIAADE